MKTLKEMVAKGKVVNFMYYRAGNLWYVTEDNFAFPVPISDIGDATFHPQDKAILFMRYIRKYMAELEKS